MGDDTANDGAAGEGDNIHSDCENLIGGVGNDTITGNDLNNTIDGNAGNDVIHGGAGDDHLIGNEGNDVLYGDAGNNFLEGDNGDDILYGGPGVNTYYGDDPAASSVAAGNDTIYARNGNAENVNCGPGADTAVLDYNDVVPSDPASACENISRSAAPSSPTPVINPNPNPTPGLERRRPGDRQVAGPGRQGSAGSAE